MTPTERAEKIDAKIYEHTFESAEDRVAWIAAQIEEARAEGFHAAREMAAEIVNESGKYCAEECTCELVSQIRALSPEDGTSKARMEPDRE